MPGFALPNFQPSRFRPLSGGVSISFDAPLSVADDASVSTVIATASVNGQDGPHTFTLTDDASGQFAITTGGELSVAAALTTGAQSITISADNGVDDPVVATRSVSVFDPVYVVWAVGGQSQLISRATYDSGAAHPAGTLQYNQSSSLVAATIPLDHVDDDSGDMGPDIDFAIDYVAANPTHRVVFVPGCKGGSALNGTSEWGVGGTLSDALIDKTNALITANPSYVLGGILWAQGGGDVGSTTYRADQDAQFAEFRSGITEADDTTPIVMAALAPQSLEGDAGRQAINDIIVDTPNRVQHTFVVADNDLTTFDGTHYNAASLRLLGSRLNSGIASAEANNTINVNTTGDLANQEFVEDTGTGTYDASIGFVGFPAPTYSLTSPPTGVTINSSTGVISVNTALAAIQSGTAITVNASNGSTSDSDTFDLTITEASAADPETGLTVSNTFAPAASVLMTDVDQTNPAVLAMDFTGLDGSSGGIIFEVGRISIGAYIGFRANGDFVARCGSGNAPWAANTGYVLDTTGTVDGDGTLVVEFTPGTPVEVRAWWNGVLLTAGVDGASNTQWATGNAGGYLTTSVGTGTTTVDGEITTSVVTYTTASNLRIYDNQSSAL